MLPSFFDSVLQLIVRTSTDLPPDVRAAMKTSLDVEPAGRHAGRLRRRRRSSRRTSIWPPIRKARFARTRACRPSRSTCGSARIKAGCAPRFARRWPRPRGAANCGPTRSIRSPARTAATISVRAHRIIHFDQWERSDIEIKLIPQRRRAGRNTNARCHALPVELPASADAPNRTLDGVRKCILHAVWNAQGKGCSPGAVGVCVGGDRIVRLPPCEGTALSDARRRESRSAVGGRGSVDHVHRQQPRHRHDGFRR